MNWQSILFICLFKTETSGDSSWKKLSQTLDAGAKIYGFRVDSVHNETYKVLGGLNRTELVEGSL